MQKPLPLRPNLEQLKKQAKLILRGHRAADPTVLRQIQEHHPLWRKSSGETLRSAKLTLSDAQLVIAAQYGFASWAALKTHVLAQISDPGTAATGIVRAFFEAAGRGDVPALAALLDAHPALIQEQHGTGVRTALHEAVDSRNDEAVRLLLERGADPNIRCEGDNATPLHFAAEKQLFSIIRLLIEHGADPIGEGDYHELEVLGWATAWDYVHADKAIVDYLLAHGARHNIFSAVAMGDTSAIREAVSRNRTVLDQRMDLTNKRRRPLHLAVVKKQPSSLVALLDLGANLESLDEAGFSALDDAALRGEQALAQILLDRGAKVRLPAAFALRRARDVEKLLRRDPEILKPGKRWGNLIVRACETASGAVIEDLVNAGANVNVRDDPKTSIDSTSGYTPLHAAAWNGNMEAASVLLKHGANVQARDERYGSTPAGWADFAGRHEVRDLILQQGPVDLMDAIRFGLVGRIQAILAEEPEALNRPFGVHPLDATDEDGWQTPLALAVIAGRTEVVRLLLAQGAAVTVDSPEKHTLPEIAQRLGHTEIASLLAQVPG